MTTIDRAAFEKHIDGCIASEVGLEQALVRDGFGDYCVPWVASKWSAWCAALQSHRLADAGESMATVKDSLTDQAEPVGWFIDVTVNDESVGDYQLAAREHWGDLSVCTPLYRTPQAAIDDYSKAADKLAMENLELRARLMRVEVRAFLHRKTNKSRANPESASFSL